jgi:hypothetical protein
MKTNTVRQRLKIYNKALKDFEKGNQNTFAGFCNYFSDYMFIIKDLLELYRCKPRKNYKFTYTRINGSINFHNAYWYKPENTTIRIRDIKKAIEDCKNQLK